MTRWLMIDLVYLGHTTLAAAEQQHCIMWREFFFFAIIHRFNGSVSFFFRFMFKIVFALLGMMKSDFRAQFKLINKCNVWLFI